MFNEYVKALDYALQPAKLLRRCVVGMFVKFSKSILRFFFEEKRDVQYVIFFVLFDRSAREKNIYLNKN